MSDGMMTVTSVSTDGSEKSETVHRTQEAEDKAAEKKRDVSGAASELGKRGGKAAAKARAEAKAAEEEAPKVEAKPRLKAKAAPEAETEPEEEAPKRKEPTPQPDAGDDDEEEPEPDDNEEDRPEGHPRHDARARMKKATEQAKKYRETLAERERELAEMRGRMAEVDRQRGPRQEEPEREQEPEYPGRPKIEDFSGDNAFEDWHYASLKWDREAAEAKSRILGEQHQRQEGHRKQAESLKQSVLAAHSEEPFLDDMPADLLRAHPRSHLQQGVRGGPLNDLAEIIYRKPDEAPTLMRHFAQNPKDYQRIKGMRSASDVQEFVGYIKAKYYDFEDEPEEKPKRQEWTPTAKSAIRPVEGRGSAAEDDGSPDSEGFGAFMKREDARQKRGSRR